MPFIGFLGPTWEVIGLTRILHRQSVYYHSIYEYSSIFSPFFRIYRKMPGTFPGIGGRQKTTSFRGLPASRGNPFLKLLGFMGISVKNDVF